jgi:dihydroneopterin aldolase
MSVVLELRDLRCIAVIGAFEAEREAPQPLRIDVDVEVDTAATTSDALEDTVDYGALCELATETVRSMRPQLLEAAASGIATALLAASPRIGAVTATVTKLRPPVASDLATAGVRVRVAR